MKKSLLILLLTYNSTLFSQTILTSYPLDLKKSEENSQILNAENTVTHDVFAFIVNKRNLTILKYNSALFLTDQYTGLLLNLDNKSIIGYSFSEDRNPTLYWASTNFNEIIVIEYFLENKTFKALKFRFPSSNQYVIKPFQKNNLFYILTKELSEQTLTLYSFKNGIAEEKIFDFSGFLFQNKNTQKTTFNTIIEGFPIEKMEVDNYNPLFKSTQKSKIYMLDQRIILTLDHNPKKTQVFDLTLENDTIIEKNFAQPIPKKASRSSNSFFHENKIFQVNANAEELLFDVKDYDSGLSLKNISVSKNDTIRFKNSPLLIQSERGRAKELSKTKKFLQHLSNLDIGVSVFKNKKNTLITFGGTPKNDFTAYYSSNNLGFDQQDDEYRQLFPQNNFSQNIYTETVFFESSWDKNFEFNNQEPQPLAIDNISDFLSQHEEVTLENTIKFKDYYILGYYDTTTKEYVMRKFKDGFN
jgi:hypothetical protein